MTKTEVKLSRRGMLFKIARIVTSKLITGNYRFPHVTEISAEDLNKHMQIDKPLLLIDTRSMEEFGSGFGHIPNSKHVPLMALVANMGGSEQFKAAVKKLEAQFDEVDSFREHEVVTICPGGGFSLVAAEIMSEAGFKDVKSLSGGVDGWFKKGYPTTLA